MSFLIWRNRTKTNYAPASYSLDETTALFQFQAGDLIGAGACQVRTAFNGTGGRTFSLGDAGSTTRFAATTDADITTAGIYQLLGALTYAARGEHLYTAQTTVNIYFTAATGGAPSAGSLDLRLATAKQFA